MAISRIDHCRDLPAELRGGIIAIGNFDGVHRGHQAVLTMARAEADKIGAPLIVLTFEPHPRAFFSKETVYRLTPPSLRARLLEALGVTAVVEQEFDDEFAALSPEAFIEKMLCEGLGARAVIVGHDFHFGHKRAGTPDMLADEGKRRGFDVEIVEPETAEDGLLISSTTIRQALADHDLAHANGLLGYRHTVVAQVEKGQQLGRTLGYPTANMSLPEETELALGIYAVRFRRADGTLHNGVASFGRRPTVTEKGAPLLETFLFGFSGDLYGETCSVSLFSWLRGEEKFDGLDPLIAQMKRDEEEARAVLAGVQPLGPLDLPVSFDGLVGDVAG
ncbi:bifunctional riboflavin kinase/FAD synthetase [Notoacmeibacter ruber]|uniref:Riboflavin biosynthesis protein n=1 Tax=Notoacmeibacter ruber TaxID=2670375 RepID=A0A3L7J9V0_9HYPH|nr:bifunctional riboflavin kinase/FAD synthetase [Notoacmeibacter ruber]RLQ87270.1 bifunctional riboflavin kinase/FAD synthetase [Notoacmeibacter ruber]